MKDIKKELKKAKENYDFWKDRPMSEGVINHWKNEITRLEKELGSK